MSTERTERPHCSEVKDNGEPCNVTVHLSASTGKCLWHDPERREQAEAVRARGRANAAKARQAPFEAASIDDAPAWPEDHEGCQSWLAWLAVAVVTGQIPPQHAREATNAIKELRQSYLDRDIESRLARLERARGKPAVRAVS
jgi:hypothetical protein